MNKKQLIARIQRYMGPGATRRTASAALEAVLSGVLETVNGQPTGESEGFPAARLPGLGSFQIRQRARGPRLVFRPSAKLMRDLAEQRPLTTNPTGNRHQNPSTRPDGDPS